jgi:hypothetical protein
LLRKKSELVVVPDKRLAVTVKLLMKSRLLVNDPLTFLEAHFWMTCGLPTICPETCERLIILT